MDRLNSAFPGSKNYADSSIGLTSERKLGNITQKKGVSRPPETYSAQPANKFENNTDFANPSNFANKDIPYTVNQQKPIVVQDIQGKTTKERQPQFTKAGRIQVEEWNAQDSLPAKTNSIPSNREFNTINRDNTGQKTPSANNDDGNIGNENPQHPKYNSSPKNFGIDQRKNKDPTTKSDPLSIQSGIDKSDPYFQENDRNNRTPINNQKIDDSGYSRLLPNEGGVNQPRSYNKNQNEPVYPTNSNPPSYRNVKGPGKSKDKPQSGTHLPVQNKGDDHILLTPMTPEKDLSSQNIKNVDSNGFLTPHTYQDSHVNKMTRSEKQRIAKKKQEKMKQHLPEHAEVDSPTATASKKKSFSRTQYMNDLTQAGKESFTHAKSLNKYGIKSRKELMNPELAWGGPYSIPHNIHLPSFAKLIEITEPRTQMKPQYTDSEKLKKKSRATFYEISRNLNNFHTYTGEFENRNPSGYGILVYENGEAYRGQWKKGLFHGTGIFITKNGNGYSGEFKDGRPEGKGEIWIWNWFERKVQDQIVGEWINGKWHPHMK